jgi:TRAP-type C4-dicarboxylate transport system permease small subunit
MAGGSRPEDRGSGGAEDLGRKVDEAARQVDMYDLDAGASLVDRLVNRIAEVIGVGVLSTIVTLVFANAVGRYAAGAPLIWAEELVIALIPWLAMSGVFLSIRRRHVIRIDVFANKLEPVLRDALGIFVAVLSAATFTALAYYAFSYVSLFGGDRTVYLKLPTGWFMSAMLIGAAAAAIAFAVDAWRRHSH